MRIRHFFTIRIRLEKNTDPDPDPAGKIYGSGSGWKKDTDPAGKNTDPDPTFNRNDGKNIFIFLVGRYTNSIL